MTLSEQALEKAANWRPEGRQTLTVSETGRSVNLTADHGDEVGCRIWEIEVTGPAPADLKSWGAALAARATGLLEPLRLHEADIDVVLLRSDNPAKREGRKAWYEVRLTGDGSATLRRYSTEGTASRTQQTFTLTHEAIAKFVADVTASEDKVR